MRRQLDIRAKFGVKFWTGEITGYFCLDHEETRDHQGSALNFIKHPPYARQCSSHWERWDKRARVPACRRHPVPWSNRLIIPSWLSVDALDQLHHSCHSPGLALCNCRLFPKLPYPTSKHQALSYEQLIMSLLFPRPALILNVEMLERGQY